MRGGPAKLLISLLAALLLAALLPLTRTGLPGRAEAAPTEAEIAEAAEPAFDGAVDPLAPPAQDAGNAGLIVEFEGMPDRDGLELGEIDLPSGDGAEPPATEDDGASPEEGGLVLAGPELGCGYYGVAVNARVYADAAMTRVAGGFPEGATVYAEAVDNGEARLRIRFDTEDARGWAREIPTGYVSAESVLALTQAETEALVASLDADARTREAEGVPVPCASYAAEDGDDEAAAGLGVAAHTPSEIQAFVDAHPSYIYQTNLYSIAARDDPYEAGRLSAVNQRSVLNLLNQVRYIAGLNSNLTLLSEREAMMAATALVLRLNGGLSHYPARPEALADAAYDDLYALGYSGAGRSNIAMGYTATSAILAYMADADDHNMADVGHRRWILNPRMGRTVAGANGRFSAMYAHDLSDAGGQTKVAWPAREMPTQYFSAEDPWSLSYGRALEAAQVEVSLVRVRDGKTWYFSQSRADGYFNVNNSGYGQKGCVIFRPDGLGGILLDDVFNVAVTDGANGEVTRYSVHFFALDLSAATPLDKPEVTAVMTDAGNAIRWTPVAGAAGYYVCRRTADTNYAIIADVADGTAYLDAGASGDQRYYYQVYPHTDSLTCSLMSSVPALPPEPDSIRLNVKSTVRLYTNATLQLEVAMSPACSETTLTWKSSNRRVAVVDEGGRVTPLKKGTAKITVTTGNKLKKVVTVKVVPPPSPSRVTLDRTGTVKLNLGDKLTLSARVSPAAADQSVKWSSSARSVARVSRGGVVKALKPGTATITVKTANGKQDTVKVKVVDPKAPTKVRLDRSDTVKLYVGDRLTLSATLSPATAVSALKWSSSRRSVAAVSGKGVVKALKAGTATITVKTANGKKDTVKVKVLTPRQPASVALDVDGGLELYVGDRLTLSAKLSPASARSALKWTSSDGGVASVSGKGVVTALSTGTATIAVETGNGKRDEVVVRVPE